MKAIEDLIGTMQDAVICAWHKRPEHGRRGLGSGFAKLLDANGNCTSLGLYVREEAIVSLGSEILQRGSRIYCLVGEPEPGYKTCLALNVEIYMPNCPADSSDSETEDAA
jgi:hypothetical protein